MNFSRVKISKFVMRKSERHHRKGRLMGCPEVAASRVFIDLV
jgi:hypothetical protein